ncbi:MAG: cysteine desulfurase family protein [Oscillospiraceae bacterium]|nr:cysteine desulfurase [Oscillospiraceae bacterium]MDD7354333.1 cysteine desulfurase family protein [Oscillospiraceae bacterium]MDY3938636.1 cysteine desulfurase family protein [Oscillospiraceae bacterium]
MEIYLDNSATTKVCPEAVNEMVETLTHSWGNPSSLHKKGVEASRVLENARARIARVFSCSPDEVYFTSSGTTANNTAIFGAVYANRRRGNRIVTTSLEHPSVNEAMKRLEEQGFEVIRLRPDKFGRFSLNDLYSVINKNTILVSIMMVNNELGTINPVQNIKTAVMRAGAPALIHVDAVQAFGKIHVKPSKIGADLISVSSHKIHGPKGAGALYIKKGVRIKPYVVGGGQENGVFSGTEAMPNIAGFGAAAAELGDIDASFEKVRGVRDRFIEKVTRIPGVYINSPSDSLPYIINMSVTGLPSQTVVNSLSERGIYISAGSACKRGHDSEVLKAIGLPSDRTHSAIRISMSRFTTDEEMNETVDAIAAAVSRIRR